MEFNDTTIFLSHNSNDKQFVRALAAALAVAGARIWFDEWKIRPGDSIPGAIDEGIEAFDIFVLIWSDAASNSKWVETEMHSAINRWITNNEIRLIPVRLDSTPIPSLIGHVQYINGVDGNHLAIARKILGIESDSVFRIAVQEFINEAGLEFREFHGAGLYVCCPSCGANSADLEGWHSIDDIRDDQYAGAKCTKCGWTAGGEI